MNPLYLIPAAIGLIVVGMLLAKLISSKSVDAETAALNLMTKGAKMYADSATKSKRAQALALVHRQEALEQFQATAMKLLQPDESPAKALVPQ